MGRVFVSRTFGMVTHFLGREEVLAYLRDLLVRLERFDAVPTVWCPLTRSGNALLRHLLDLVASHHPQLADSVSVLPIEVKDVNDEVHFLQGDPAKDIPGKNVMIFDGATHSGQMMTNCAREALRYGAAGVCTYSLVLKRGSKFIPTLWGVTVDDTDRTFFLLDKIPNNRLDAGCLKSSTGRRALNIHLRVLAESDLKKPPVVSELDSLDRVTWGDRYFDMKAGGKHRCSYVLEKGSEILGYLTLSHPEAGRLSIDEVAVDRNHRGKNIGAVLVRFADTMARQFDCLSIQLQAVANKRDFYKGFGYKVVTETPLTLDDEEYWLMEKPVIYNQSLLS